MCEIMTIAAALAFTALYFVGRSRGWRTNALFTTMLIVEINILFKQIKRGPEE